jgi:hypothetical protein
MIDPLYTRVGVILHGNNRFLGRETYDAWNHELVTAGDALLAALGATQLDATAREALRLGVLCLISPDARVWPLKLTRILASYGDPLAGLFAGQLVTAGRVMGPNAAQYAAMGLAYVAERVGEAGSDDDIRGAMAEWKQRVPGGKLGGFGVPFREADERRDALLRYVENTAIADGRHWRLHTRVVKVMESLRPNIVISLAAMVLDLGIPATRAGAALSAFMAPVFLAHALEAAEQDGARLHSLPPDVVDYRGPAARTTVARPR